MSTEMAQGRNAIRSIATRLIESVRSKLRVQLTLAYLLLVLLALAAAVGLSHRGALRAVEAERRHAAQKLADLFMRQAEDYFRQIDHIFFQFALREELIARINAWRAASDPSRRILLRRDILNVHLFELVHSEPSVRSIAYYDDVARVVLVADRERGAFSADLQSLERPEFPALISGAKERNSSFAAPHPAVPGERMGVGEELLSFARRIRNPRRLEEDLGVVIVTVEQTELEAISDGALVSPGSVNLLLDARGRVIFSSDDSVVPAGAEWSDSAAGDRHLVYASSPVVRAGLSARVLVPKEELYAAARPILMRSLLILGVTIMIAAFGVNTVARRVTQPLEAITARFVQMTGGDLNQEIVTSRKDEVGKLSIAFNQLAARMRRLVYQEYQARLNEQDAQLKALQFQMDPHFIYNTLQLILSLAALNRVNDIQEVAEGLGNLLHYTMGDDEARAGSRAAGVPLRRELEYVRSYLFILRKRFGDRLSFSIDVEESLMDITVLKLTLQPVIENALVHGMGDDPSARLDIRLNGYRSNGKAVLEVSDNGNGMTAERLSEVQRSLRGEPREFYSRSRNLGLANLHARMRLFYAGRGCVSVHSRPGRGTVVTFELPALPYKKEDRDGCSAR